jgi:Plasmid pRiA4b ORF-3-like protein
MSEPSVSALAIYQLRAVLCRVSPLVWRRLLVVNETSFGELHEILQNAFDWSGEQLRSFFAFALLPFYLFTFLPFETAAKRPEILLMRLCFHSPPNFVQRDNGFWHTFMHQKRSFSANV